MQKLNEWTIPYTPHAKQLPFHNDRYTYRYRLISGGTGSGKTKAGVFEMLAYLLDDNPGAVGYIFEPTYRMVRRILIPALESLLGYPLDANYVIKNYMRSDNCITFRNGSRLWFGGLEDPEMAEGPNIDVIMVDEARLVHHFDVAWRVIQRRIRGSVPGKYRPCAYITTTPDAPGSVLHKFFEDPRSRNPNSNVYRFGLEDNPHLTPEYIEAIKASHHGGLAERFIHGRFAAVGVGTIPFDYTKHVIKINPALFKDRVFGVDFGWTNPSCILAVGFDGDGRALVVDEFYKARVTHDLLREEAKQMVMQWGKGKFYCDPTEKQTIESLKSHGIQAIKNEAKRDEGIREMAGRFAICGDGRPRIYISPLCVNLIAELQVYNEAIKENDHAVDALRYALGSRMKKKSPVVWKSGPVHRSMMGPRY